MILRKSVSLLVTNDFIQNSCRYLRVEPKKRTIKVWKLLVLLITPIVAGYGMKYAGFYYNEGFRDYLRQSDPSWKNIGPPEAQKEFDSENIKKEIESVKKSIS